MSIRKDNGMSIRIVKGKVRFYEGYCSECHKECEGIDLDFGVGTTEFWGSIAYHNDRRHVSTCCDAEIIPYEDAEQCRRCGLHFHHKDLTEGHCPECYEKILEEERKEDEREPNFLCNQRDGIQIRL